MTPNENGVREARFQCEECRELLIEGVPCLCERAESHFDNRSDDPVTAPGRWVDKAEWGHE